MEVKTMIGVIDIDSINELPMEVLERVNASVIYNVYGLDNSEPDFDIVYKIAPKHYIFL